MVKKGLWAVNNGEKGTAKWWKIPGVEIAGKTGTAQLFNLSSDQVFAKCEERPIKQRHHGWYVGFAPFDDPKIVVAVLAEHACHGSTGGAPVARDIIRAYMKKYFPEEIKSKKKFQQAGIIRLQGDNNAD
jgi:penicillin-binding protein 2